MEDDQVFLKNAAEEITGHIEKLIFFYNVSQPSHLTGLIANPNFEG